MVFQDPTSPDYGWKKPVLALTMVMLVAWGAFAEGSDFTAESPECANCFQFFEPAKRVWSGPVTALFNPEGSENLGGGNVRRAIERAIKLVQLYVYIDIELQGETNITPIDVYNPDHQNTIIFNMANLSYPRIGEAYLLWAWSDGPELNQARATLGSNMRRACLNGAVLHELLHTLYIDHSETRHSIMAATPYNSCEYQATLRLDDIEALQAIYPPKPNRQGVITSFDSTQVCGYQPEVVVEGTSYQVEACSPASAFGSVVIN